MHSIQLFESKSYSAINSDRIISSPIPYMGNKKRLINKGLIRMFPNNINTFVDLFAGSGIVSMNTRANKIILNDIDSHLIELYYLFQKHSADEIILHIEKRIHQFGLAPESTKRYIFTDKEKIDQYKRGYIKLRDEYNKSKSVFDFCTLTYFSFSQQFRFNANGNFNMPYFPSMKHLGDITKIHGDEIEPVDVLTGGSPCFPSGTMILTTNGYIPIEKIDVGDMVLTHKNRWRKVTAIGNRESETYYLKGNVTIETTANHPIYSADIKHLKTQKRNSRKTLINIGVWTKAENMEGKQWATPTTSEKLPIPLAIKTGVNQKPMPNMNNDFWYFVGRWLGDGWVRNGYRKERPNGNGYGTIYICDSHDKKDELTNIVSKISDNYSIEQCRTGVKVRFTSHLLCEWLVNNFGKGAINKTIPGWVLSMSYEHRTALFSGIIDSDGYRKSDTSMKVTSISKQLVLGIRMLAESLGYTTSISYFKRPNKCVIEGRVVNQHDTYTVTIVNNTNRRTGIIHDGHKWYKCRDVIKTGEIKTVYNISVDEDESYIADSIVVHNCQDLSVAGKQSGIKMKCDNCGTFVNFKETEDLLLCPNCGSELNFTRSGLFMEQIRIIKEMRKNTNECYPKIVVWENVPGALSSNNGDDFYCVLQEFCKLMAEKIPTFRPEKWSNSGEILGESCSIAWRILDAQYWGVPHRRRRIFLVADFTGQHASEILFKSESLRRYTTPSRAPWKRFTIKTKKSIGTASRDYKGKSEIDDSVFCVSTKQTNAEDGVYCLQGNCIDRSDTAGCNGKGWKENVCYTLNTVDRPAVAYTEQSNNENHKPYVAAFAHQQGSNMPSLPYGEEVSPTLIRGQTMAVLIDNHSQDCRWTEIDNGICPTLTAAMCTEGNNTPFVIEKLSEGSVTAFGESGFADYTEDKISTLKASGGHNGGGSETLIVNNNDSQTVNYFKPIVRRLTPLECERLQGFPDDWTYSESDSARYKAIGNSVALPCVDYIMSGIREVLDDFV